MRALFVLISIRLKQKKNTKINNKGKNHSIEDLTWQGNELFVKKFKKYFDKIPFIRLNKFTKFLKKKNK